jgi:D-glycero-alpha-D-manno-heptose-7-phosphate kinase
MRVQARAPTRIDLAGGTLDIWPLYLFHQPAITLNVAISLYATCTIELRSGTRAITLISRDTRSSERFGALRDLAAAKRHQLPLLAHFVKFFAPASGLTITTDCQAPAGAGLGGSSAAALAIAAAFDRLTGRGASRADWVRLSRDIETTVLGVPTGSQDQFAAAFGAVSCIHLRPGDESRSAVKVSHAELERRLVLCYTGKPRRSSVNNWRVYSAHLAGDRRVRQNIRRIAEIAWAMAQRLSQSDWNDVGRLLREEWNFRRRNLPTISTPAIDRIIAGARRAGALGGKACGAGGGGCVVLLIDPEARRRVEATVRGAGARLLPVHIDALGVRSRLLR